MTLFWEHLKRCVLRVNGYAQHSMTKSIRLCILLVDGLCQVTMENNGRQRSTVRAEARFLRCEAEGVVDSAGYQPIHHFGSYDALRLHHALPQVLHGSGSAREVGRSGRSGHDLLHERHHPRTGWFGTICARREGLRDIDVGRRESDRIPSFIDFQMLLRRHP